MLSNVAFVMVTYGDRIGFVAKAINPILNSTRATIIIVSNGLNGQVLEKLKLNFLSFIQDDRLIIVENEYNEGSAGGYYIGLSKALSIDKEYTFLLDDDNRLSEAALYLLSDKIRQPIHTAYACYRCDRAYMTNIINGMSADKVFPSRNSFVGFSFSRLINKLFVSNPFFNANKSIDASYQLKWAPYGGLLFKTAWLNDIGLPRKDYFLYADDTEFTYRLKNTYGLELEPNIAIEDLEKSWNVATKRNLFSRLLLDGENWKVYYSVRNQAHFDFNIYRSSKFKVLINATSFFVILTFFFLRHVLQCKKIPMLFSRYTVLFKACFYGAIGNLGSDHV